MVKKKSEEEEDVFFSKLPDDVIIHILSYLDTPTAAKTSILCKRFTTLWHSLPSIILPKTKLLLGCDLNALDILDFVFALILTVSERNNTLRKLYLSFGCTGTGIRRYLVGGDDPIIYDHEIFGVLTLRRLMMRAFKMCLGELELSFSRRDSTPPLDLLVSSAPKSLTSMKFMRAKFQNLHNLISTCPLLRELSLVECDLESQDVLISGSELRALDFKLCFCGSEQTQARLRIEAKNLQTFSYAISREFDDIVFIESPDSLKKLNLNGNFKTCWLEATIPKFLALESLSIHADHTPATNNALKISSQSLKNLDLMHYSIVPIDSPILTSLAVETCGDRFSISSSRNHGFRSIKSLVFSRVNLEKKGLKVHLRKFQQLQQLKLIGGILGDKINISHRKLERLEICECWDTVQAHIYTPRLRSFTYNGRPLVLKNFTHSTSLEVALHWGHETTLSFSGMSLFLEPYKSCKVLTMNIRIIEWSIKRDWEPFEAEVLVLRFDHHPLSYKVLVKSLLRMCCHPNLVKIISMSEVKSIEFKYKETTSTKVCHCGGLSSGRYIKCWTRRLERVMLTNISSEQLNLQNFFKKNCEMLDVSIQVN